MVITHGSAVAIVSDDDPPGDPDARVCAVEKAKTISMAERNTKQ